ncbi:hypothetical protein E2C01_046947 [Portunus trituberculatus]|uniref:Uncharacterized protein n=1 Tax=Portunus trituberculatus TaxID=210409 RepID=A0A5B7G735_PORTR|nr:hypothetical protein [Portunus trituberculatus]
MKGIEGIGKAAFFIRKLRQGSDDVMHRGEEE